VLPEAALPDIRLTMPQPRGADVVVVIHDRPNGLGEQRLDPATVLAAVAASQRRRPKDAYDPSPSLRFR
jgi:hypothetical protein